MQLPSELVRIPTPEEMQAMAQDTKKSKKRTLDNSSSKSFPMKKCCLK